MLITPALDGIKSYTSVIAQLINPIVFSIKRLTFATKITFFSRNHQENYKKSATQQQNLPKSAKSPDRAGQNLRHLRIENRRPKGKPNLRDPLKSPAAQAAKKSVFICEICGTSMC